VYYCNVKYSTAAWPRHQLVCKPKPAGRKGKKK
jgi:hypothetical protein